MLDQPVPNPLAKNPNVNTHKVFASVGLILIGLIIILSALAIIFRGETGNFLKGLAVNDQYKDKRTGTKPATISAKIAEKNETAGWKTFSNDVEKYSINYPTDWLITNCEMNPVFFAPIKPYLGACNSGFGGLIGISTVTETTFSDLENSYISSDYNNLVKEKTTLNGKETTKITGVSKVVSEISDETGTKRIVYLVNLGTSTLSITYSQSKGWQDYSKEFESMVSTLKFLSL